MIIVTGGAGFIGSNLIYALNKINESNIVVCDNVRSKIKNAYLRKGKYRSALKEMSVYMESGKIDKAKNFLPKFHSRLMKIAKTGAISKKTVSRKISRVTKKIQNKKK